MFNLRFIFSPGSCGWFCLKFILKKRIKKEYYLSLFRVKELLNENGYYCSCLKINDLKEIKMRCLTLIINNKKEFHYVVVMKLDDEYIYYYDPLFVFARKKKIDDFLKKWSNICLFYTCV